MAWSHFKAGPGAAVSRVTACPCSFCSSNERAAEPVNLQHRKVLAVARVRCRAGLALSCQLASTSARGLVLIRKRAKPAELPYGPAPRGQRPAAKAGVHHGIGAACWTYIVRCSPPCSSRSASGAKVQIRRRPCS